MPETEAVTSSRLGRYIRSASGGEEVRAFLPPPLPPEPPLQTDRIVALLDRASRAVGRLDGAANVLPDTDLFLYMYVRKEALLSSQIEGTQSSLSDLLLFENAELPGAPLDDVREVSNYVTAIEHGLARLREGMPISLRLIREIHSKLLDGGRGAAKQPGEFRRSQNWIGGTRPGNAAFVPPPPDHLLACLSDLEKFIHAETPTIPPLIKAGLVHVQFETIHPFLDGNGRLGRLLITLMLCAKEVLKKPLLYLSLYLKTHRQTYYDLLQRVRQEGAWEAWIEFFLAGVAETAQQAADTAQEILALFDSDRRIIERLGRPAGSALRVHQLLQTKPILSVPEAVRKLGLSKPTVGKSVRHLEAAGILKETTGKQRNRSFFYPAYLSILNRGTEPLPR